MKIATKTPEERSKRIKYAMACIDSEKGKKFFLFLCKRYKYASIYWDEEDKEAELIIHDFRVVIN